MLPLAKVCTGKYIISKIENSCPGAKQRLTALGIFTGDEIEVTKPSPGPVIFEKGGTRIGIGHGIAMRILVEKIAETKPQTNPTTKFKTAD